MLDLSPLSFPKPLAVLGLGISGEAVAQACKAAGIPFDIWVDMPEVREKFKDQYRFTDFSNDLSGYSALLSSPGVKPTHPVIVKARAQNIPIISDIDLLLRAAPDAKVIGITGTNGKSTTTALIGHILQHAGIKAEVGGNIGRAACSLPNLGKDGVYVLELSSYQLAITSAPIADIAVLLNITPDHLDWHPDFDDYTNAKKKIFTQHTGRPQQTAIIGIDTDTTKNLKPADHRIVTISTQDKADVYVQNGILFSGPEKIADLTTHAYLKGQHNFENIAAAFAVCREYGLTSDVITQHMFTFQGLPHRQKNVGEIGNVTFINDSKATNADASSRALASFDNIYWIAGGLPKSDGIDNLEKFYPKIHHAFLIGEAQERFAVKLEGHLPYTKCHTLDKAISTAFEKARQDKNPAIVLLSPACASFDQFKNFEERGNMFAKIVEELKA